MKRSILLLVVVVLAAPLHAQGAPAGARLPVLRPTATTVLAGFRDSAGVLPDAPLLSPNGRLIAYRCGTSRYGTGLLSSGHDVCIWNVLTHDGHALVMGSVHALSWGPKGDALVLTTDAGQLRYPLRWQGEELTRDQGIWVVPIDSMTGVARERPRLVATVAANRPPVLSPDEQIIAFVWPHGGYVMSLSVVPAAGGAPRILATGIEVSKVQWSADGSAVYYSAHVNSSSPTRTRFSVPLAGGVPVPIEQERPIPPAVDDNVWEVRDPSTGRTVAHMEFPSDVSVSDWLTPWPGRRELAGVRYVRPIELRVISLADGSIRSNLTDTTAGVVTTPQWFAGSRVALIVQRRARCALLTQDADGSHARTYALSGRVVGDQLRVSPDGRYAVFHGRRGGYGMIELVDLASGRQRTLVTSAEDFADGSAPEGRGIGALAWTQDSKRVRYISDVWTPQPAVHEVTLTGGDRILRPLPTSIYGPPPALFASSTHPDLVEFTGRNYQGGGFVSLVPIGAGLPRVVLPEPALGGPLSPDGHALAVQIVPANGQGGIQIKIVSLDNSASVRSISLPFLALPGIKWHPDGEHLLVLGREKAGAPLSVYSVPINGDTPFAVAPAGSTGDEAVLAVSLDGRFVAVTVAGTPRATFVKLVYDVAGVFSLGRQ